MTVTEQYERLYKTAVDEIIEAMAVLKGNNIYGDQIIKKKDLIDRWCKIIEALAPTAQIDLDSEAVEAIRRAHTK